MLIDPQALKLAQTVIKKVDKTVTFAKDLVEEPKENPSKKKKRQKRSKKRNQNQR